ncbi:MAG: ATP-binding protein [Candidatus Nealsonbacteria bacterium]
MTKKPSPKIKGETRSIMARSRKNFVSRKEQQRQRRLLLALERVSEVLTVEVDLHKILKDMALIVAKALGAKWVNFWELTPDKKGTFITAMYGMKPEYVEHSKKEPIRLGKAWIGRAIKTGKAWATNDILTDPKTMKELGENWNNKIKQQDYRALLCVPTISRKGPVGGMCVYYPDVHEFTDFEMRLVTITANQAATSITNAQIFHELVAERNKTLATIQSLQDGLIMYDLENRIIFFNPKAEEFLWLRAKNVIGKRLDESFQKKSIYWKNLWNINRLVQGEYASKEYSTEGPQKLVLEITCVPVRDQYQKIGAMQVLRNVTKEKEVELLKSNFITTASHQLRTPLSGIKWSLDALAKETLGSLNPEQKGLVKQTFDVNERLIGLVADLLDVSRIEEGKFGYNFRLGDISKLVMSLFNKLKPNTERLKINFEFKTPLKPLPKISFDASKLDIAIRNVIDNAIKYTKPGGFIKIEFRVEKNSLFLIVQDNGIGIPKKDQKFIFIKFFRAKNAVRFQTEGSGLGLYIAKSIAEKHNAIINFDSEENKGSTFIFQFPLDVKKIPKGIVKGF